MVEHPKPDGSPAQKNIEEIQETNPGFTTKTMSFVGVICFKAGSASTNRPTGPAF
jgi:hypothetical protein